MMNIIVTIHNDNFKELADLTWNQNRKLYAEKYQYHYYTKTNNFKLGIIGFEKIKLMLDLLDKYPQTKLMLWTGTDTMITNFNIRLEERMSKTHDVMLTGDFNEIINADVILLRNTAKTKAWLKAILDQYEAYRNHQFAEQQVMINIQKDWESVVQIMPQRFMNAYEYRLYSSPPWSNTARKDVYGNDGQWQQGDWIVHWPGSLLSTRIALANEFLPKVVK